MSELVSVIMPSYNTAELIGDSINSVLKQTYKNYELIVVDDCSTDNTEQVVKEFKDNRIKFIRLEHNSGAAVARNKALREAKGKYIAFLDSDDLWEPDKLAHQISFMKKNNYAFSYTNYIEINENDLLNGKIVTGPRRITKNGMFCYCWLGCLTAMYDAEKVGLIQIGDIRKNNDYAMWLEVIKKSDCYLLNETLAKYRRGRKGSICTENILTMVKWHYLLFKTAEKRSLLESLLLTLLNLVFGSIKKIMYVKRLKS